MSFARDADEFELRLDAIVEDFEAKVRLNHNVSIEQCLPDASVSRFDDYVVELIRVEMEYRLSRDQDFALTDYKQRFPQLAENLELLERIAFEEYRLRAQSGESVAPFDYQHHYGIQTHHWPMLGNWSQDQRTAEFKDASSATPTTDDAGSTQPDLAGKIASGVRARRGSLG